MSKENKHIPIFSRHHKIAKSRGGANGAPNNTPIDDRYHKAIHLLFNNQHTLEKIQSIIGMDEAILSDYFRKIIMDILKLDTKDVFIREAFLNSSAFKHLDETPNKG